MAGRLIRIGDLAAALDAAAARDLAAAQRLAELRLELPVLARAIPDDAQLWAMAVYQRPRPWFGFLAPLRRRRRRRAGWAPTQLTLRWTPAGIEAALGDAVIACLPPSSPQEDVR